MISGAYRVLGTNEDETFCSVCGKKDLSRVVWLESDRGEILHCGVNCASKLTKWSQAKINGQIKNAINDNNANIRYWNSHPMVIAERGDMKESEFVAFITALLRNENQNEFVIKGVVNG